MKLLASGEVSAAWAPNVLALAKAVQSAMSNGACAHFSSGAFIAGATCIAVAGVLSAFSDRFRPATAFLAGASNPAATAAPSRTTTGAVHPKRTRIRWRSPGGCLIQTANHWPGLRSISFSSTHR